MAGIPVCVTCKKSGRIRLSGGVIVYRCGTCNNDLGVVAGTAVLSNDPIDSRGTQKFPHSVAMESTGGSVSVDDISSKHGSIGIHSSDASGKSKHAIVDSDSLKAPHGDVAVSTTSLHGVSMFRVGGITAGKNIRTEVSGQKGAHFVSTGGVRSGDSIHQSVTSADGPASICMDGSIHSDGGLTQIVRASSEVSGDGHTARINVGKVTAKKSTIGISGRLAELHIRDGIHSDDSCISISSNHTSRSQSTPGVDIRAIGHDPTIKTGDVTSSGASSVIAMDNRANDAAIASFMKLMGKK
jgi:hypothetical protein